MLMTACPSTALPPLVLVDTDLMPGVNRQPIAGSVTGDSGEATDEARWLTWVFRIRLRNDGETPLRNVETRLVASDTIKELYGGTDPFAAEGGKRANYGKLPSTLDPSSEVEIKRSILVIPLLSDSDGNDETTLPDDLARFRAVQEVADQALLEITYEGGSQRFDLSGLLERKDWPPFTMVYELEQGQAVSVGDRHVDSRQVRRLEYQSATEWRETVLESPPIETRVGTFNAAGSYKQLDGRRLVEFNSVTNSNREEEIEEGVRHLPRAGFLPYGNRTLEETKGITPIKIDTGVLVCFQNECEDNAVGLLYRLENGHESVFADDSRGFPLRVGTSIVVRELRIDDEQK